MDRTRPDSWEIAAGWEVLDAGSDEERACFATLGIRAHDTWLTEGHDAIANRLRQAPYLSAYHLAEWLAWNWWRLRWEPRTKADEWAFSHRLTTIGGGYIWPDITIFSDGQRTALLARATPERSQTPFRYINTTAMVIPASEFEFGIDRFVEQVLERLNSARLKDTNLSRLWGDILRERRDPELTRRRRLEALLGYDPDEGDPAVIDRLLADVDRLGEGAVEELAADAGCAGVQRTPLSAVELREIATLHGAGISPRNAVRLSEPPFVDRRSPPPAWKLGSLAAQALRVQEQLGAGPLSDSVLATLGGSSPAILAAHETGGTDLSFVLEGEGEESRIYLRSRWHSGRRFELARLLGDRLLRPTGCLYPATRAYTYRQKMQRAFAAELLCPLESVLEMLDGDYSDEKQQDVANHFQVSELIIRNQLVNRGVLDRDEPDTDLIAPAA